MKKRLAIVFAAVMCAAAIPCATAVTAYANSAERYFTGVDATGAIMKDSQSPVIVEKEILTFDLQNLPKNYYGDEEEFIAYDGKVTAQYTLYNPSEYTVTSTLLFPFGNSPSYNGGHFDDNGDYTDFDDTEKYDITLDGDVTERVIRHSLSDNYSQFDTEKDLGAIHDDFISGGFYRPDLTVTKYTYSVSGVDESKYKAASAAFDVENSARTITYFPDMSGGRILNNGKMRVSSWIDNGDEIAVFAIGDPFTTPPEIKIYKDGGVDDGEEIGGEATLANTQTLTLKELALSNRSNDSAVSEIDWYNAFIAESESELGSFSVPVVSLSRFTNCFKNSLMRWYEYKITLSPGQRAENCVTAPLYPDIDGSRTPTQYAYTYLLSPAKTWKSFGQIEIYVNTPYYLSNSSIEGFSKTESGYKLNLGGLPLGELQFVLTTSKIPENSNNTNVAGAGFPVEIIYVIVAAVALLIMGIVIFVTLRKRKKRIK